MSHPFFDVCKVDQDGKAERDRLEPPYAVSKLKNYLAENMLDIFEGNIQTIVISRGEPDV